MTKKEGDNSSASQLQSVLSHCRVNLHKQGLFSLRQLVPIHRTLFHWMDSVDVVAPENATKSATIISLSKSFKPGDEEICERILFPAHANAAVEGEEGDDDDDDDDEVVVADVSLRDAERLLVLQYLMFPLSTHDAIQKVMLPFLQAARSVSADLEIALLDCIDCEAEHGSGNSITNSPEEPWRQTLDTLLACADPSAAHILVRLLKQNKDSPLLVQYLYDKIWDTVQAVMKDPPVCSSLHPSTTFQNHPTLSTLSKDLLPQLTDRHASAMHKFNANVKELWNKLVLQLWETHAASEDIHQNRVAMLVITTVLCPLLPHLTDVQLPTKEGPLQLPAHQPHLWDLIYSCVSQGTSALEHEGMAALSSILRRRGLFLLTTIAKTNEWKQYAMCYETLEMEQEQHLVEQVWEYVSDLFREVAEGTHNRPGVLTWDWISQLFGCVLSASLPAVRKMSMFRLLKAHMDGEGDKNKTQKSNKKNQKDRNSRPISFLDKMPPEFILRILLPSWNSLGRTVGFTMHVELQNRRLERHDMIPMMDNVLKSYVSNLDDLRATEFLRGIWDWSIQRHFGIKTFMMIYRSISQQFVNTEPKVIIAVGDRDLQNLAFMIESIFAGNAVVLNLRREVMEMVAIMLAHTRPIMIDKWKPLTILRLLQNYKQEYFEIESENWTFQNEPSLESLKQWISGMDQSLIDASAALASAFVDGELGLATKRTWDPEYGANEDERQTAWAILLFASLIADSSNRLSTGQFIWPAVKKGFANVTKAVMSATYVKADHVARASLLLESGCLLRQLSGLGNGDLVLIDKTTLMPVPPNIETMLSSAIDFCIFHIRTMLDIDANEGSNGSKAASLTYFRVVSMLRTLNQSYPSSQIISDAMGGLIQASFDAIADGAKDDSHRVMHAMLIYASLSSGAKLKEDTYITLGRSIMALNLEGDTRDKSLTWEHMARSVLFYSKWASISELLLLLGRSMQRGTSEHQKEAQEFVEWVLEHAFEVVSAAVLDAMVPVFNCILEASKFLIGRSKNNGSKIERGDLYVNTLERIVTSLIDLMQGARTSREGVYMLNHICSLIFQPRLMREEYLRLKKDPLAPSPIRDGFRRLIKMAGNERDHINRSVLCKATVGWIGADGQGEKGSMGFNAIPYAEDLVDLLLHKGVRKDEEAKNQSRMMADDDGMKVPHSTNPLSLTRAFVFVFIEKLPSVNDGLHNDVLKQLLEPLILKLLVRAEPIRSNKPALIMKGTPFYCQKMRAWQGLCILARFVTDDIARRVCEATFECLQEAIHTEVRFFVEIFAVKCGTIHPKIFGDLFLEQIVRTDLSLQQIASLMIVGGNWIVGNYKIDFFVPGSKESDQRLYTLLAGTIPWLSSTQGFSRAIAQLLVYAVIPLVVDVNEMKPDTTAIENSDILRLIHNFLEKNREMARLRRKQSNFFQSYDVEGMCTAEGILSIPVDEGDEANPSHLVNIMKQTLIDVYEEAHGTDAPMWKQVEEMVATSETGPFENSAEAKAGTGINFQRKMIPLDALNLAMESQREIKLRNAAGGRKEQLIVCASLIDKVPNLAGLARTAEIFAADRLVIPDKSVCKMDNFKSISVGAGEWIDIEQVRPQDLLEWLLEQKSKGYFIFGLEQTASSIPLQNMVFPNRPSILLLGKEKQGIPVELLQAVDQCVEIPQKGIIRSLNVHVSGAIAIWEHTKQRLKVQYK